MPVPPAKCPDLMHDIKHVPFSFIVNLLKRTKMKSIIMLIAADLQ